MAALVAVAAPAHAYSTGPPADRVGLCGARANCKDAGCHDTYPLNSGSAIAALTIDGAAPSTYGAGQLMRLVLAVTDTDATRRRFGFELGIVSDCPFAIGQGSFVITEPARTQIATGGSVEFIEHRCQTLGLPAECGYLPSVPGQNQWSFDWQAPPTTAAGQLWIYWAINAADGDSTNQGDRISLWEAVLDPDCPARVESLKLRRNDCDGAVTGREVELLWDPVAYANGYRLYRTEDPTVLADPGPLGATVVPDACDEAPGPGPLELYSVVGLCADGSDGPR